ncbi:MFS transporter [Neorhizobium sp. DT-125]|uniref:MFS transporter n=1 Tax=Neorhizobium sp. DT-125 TaxID=3396163 RepID=UPI003F1C86E7
MNPIYSVRSGPWLVVLGSTVGLMVSNAPIMVFTFGVFLKPITEEMGWSRGTMSLSITLFAIGSGLITPVVGRLTDRWGVRRVLLLAVTLFAASVAAVSLSSASVVAFVALYTISGLVSSGQSALPYAKAISSCFDAHRGLALGIIMTGVGIGAALVPLFAAYVVDSFGWREAYVALGALTWLVAFPAVFLFVTEAPATTDSPASPAMAGDDLGTVLRSRTFWAIAISILLVNTAVSGVIAHLVALMTDRGLPVEIATSMLVVVGLSTILGRLISGYLLDKIFAPYFAAAIFLVPLAGMGVLWFGSASSATGLIAAACFGFGLGAEVDVVGYLVGRYFGLRRYGEIYGYIFAIFSIGTGIGSYLMGVSFDMTHSYGTALAGLSLALSAASFIIFRLGPYRFGPSHPEKLATQAA